jgi:hypothetical protein
MRPWAQLSGLRRVPQCGTTLQRRYCADRVFLEAEERSDETYGVCYAPLIPLTLASHTDANCI